MLKTLTRRMLRRWGGRYDYDVGYLEYMLDQAPRAFFRFSRLKALSEYADNVPQTVLAGARLSAALSEDCGPCVQLMTRQATEAGLGEEEIRAILERDIVPLNADLALGIAFAEAVLAREDRVADLREDVRGRWGEAGVIELTLATVISRVYPSIKYGLGFGQACGSIDVNGTSVWPLRAA